MNKRREIIHVHLLWRKRTLVSFCVKFWAGAAPGSHFSCVCMCAPALVSFEYTTLITCEPVATAGATPSTGVSVGLDRAFVQTFIPFTATFSLETIA